MQADPFDFCPFGSRKSNFKIADLGHCWSEKERKVRYIILFTREKVGLVNPDPKPQLSLGYVVRCRFGSDLQVQNHTFRWRHKGVWLCSKCVLVKPRKPLQIVKRNVPKKCVRGHAAQIQKLPTCDIVGAKRNASFVAFVREGKG